MHPYFCSGALQVVYLVTITVTYLLTYLLPRVLRLIVCRMVTYRASDVQSTFVCFKLVSCRG